MRARNIKPGFFKNEDLADIEPLGRILFAGLWCMADRAGRLEDRPKRIKVEILPYDNCSINKLLDILQQKKFIYRYQVDKDKYIQILNFHKHQTPHIKEQASTIPEPDLHHANTIQEPDMHDTNTGQEPDLHGSCPSDSLIPDSSTDSRKNICSPDGEREIDFEDFWLKYPKKVGKQNALKAWKKLKSSDKIDAIAGVAKQLSGGNLDRERQHIKDPQGWLNGRLWQDEVCGSGNGNGYYPQPPKKDRCKNHPEREANHCLSDGSPCCFACLKAEEDQIRASFDPNKAKEVRENISKIASAKAFP